MSKKLGAIVGLGLAVAISGAGCSSTPEPQEFPTAETYYERGLEGLVPHRRLIFLTEVDYQTAIENFQEVIDNYPYSEYATLAEIKLADVHYERKQYPEAASYYQDFVELHPRHELVPHAMYRSGMCSFQQMRESDRDQTATFEAISHFRTLLRRYPDAETAEDAALRLQEAEDLLAQVDLEVGQFYFERGEYHAAVERFRRALTQFPSHTGHLTTMSMLGVALIRVGDPVSGEAILAEALASNADQELRDLIDSELREITALPGYAAMLEEVPDSPVLRERPPLYKRAWRTTTAPFRLAAKPLIALGSGAGKLFGAMWGMF